MHRSSRSTRFVHHFVVLTLTLVLAWAATGAPAFAGRIFVDPGHGGPYPGAASGGVTEAYINLLLSLSLRDALAARGHDVGMSRTSNVSPNLKDIPTWHYDDNGIRYYADGLTGIYRYSPDQSGSIPYDDLQSRCDMANRFGADVFISIHCDSSTSSSANGTATYRNWDNETDRILSERLSELVQAEMMASTSPYYSMHDDGTKTVGFYVVRWSNMPAILVESAFLSNSYERSLLLDPVFRTRLTLGMAKGIDRFLAENPFKPRFARVSGATRYGTAAQIAAKGWPSGANTVLLASGRDWPDALASTPLSVRLNAPLLLTEPHRLPSETAAALASLSPSNIVVLGGETAVATTPTVEAAAAAAGIATSAVRRIAGKDRYETATLIAEEVGIPSSDRVLMVNGAAYADALSASARAGSERSPILLTHRSELPPSVSTFLRDNPRARRIHVIGGNAVVAETLVTGLRSGTVGITPRDVGRIAGVDRYDTSVAVLENFWAADTVRPYFATGIQFPDALSAGTLAARSGNPVILLGGRFLSPYTREWLANEDSRVGTITMVGGPEALPYLMDWEIEKGLTR